MRAGAKFFLNFQKVVRIQKFRLLINNSLEPSRHRHRSKFSTKDAMFHIINHYLPAATPRRGRPEEGIFDSNYNSILCINQSSLIINHLSLIMNFILTWTLRLIPALILLQTLFFKFSAAEESVYIFTTLGVEPWGRIGSGIVELFAGLFLLYRPLNWLGADLALGTMTGAILSHLGPLGIEVMNDQGWLFKLAILTWLCCAGILIQDKDRWIGLVPFLKKV